MRSADRYWTSVDGLRLHFRDHAGCADRPPILCIPGLTRNARDFEGVAARLAGGWRVICLDLRGRGDSAYAENPASYVPPVYVEDVEALIAALGLGRFVLFGTSLGGLVAMLLAWRDAKRIAGVLINDVGPVIEQAGIDRIRSYVGIAQSWRGWTDAARHFAETQGDIYPDWTQDQWLVFARRLCRRGASGRIVLDYDMRIAEPLRVAAAADAAFDLWPAFRALDGVPTLLIRGEHSDLLGEATVSRMREEVRALDVATVPGVGHAPTLDEPEAEAAIDRLLARVAT